MLDAALDLFLGSACASCGGPGRVLCWRCDDALPRGGQVAMPDPKPAGLARVMVAGAYDGALKSLINAHKEHQRLALARPLGRVLGTVVLDLAPNDSGVRPVLLVPVPSRPVVVRRRGHDPLLRIARAASAELRRHGRQAGVLRLLRVARRAQDQAGLDEVARRRNLAGALRCVRRIPVAATATATMVIVDDVVTTGSTAREAQRALEVAGLLVAGVAAIAATKRRSLPLDSWGD